MNDPILIIINKLFFIEIDIPDETFKWFKLPFEGLGIIILLTPGDKFRAIPTLNVARPRSPGSRSTVFTRISAAALIKFFSSRVRRLIEGGAYSRAALN